MRASQGDHVQVHYTGKLDNQQVFDSSSDRDPIEFVIGENQVIPGFENAILGMSVGETKEISIPSDKAYGPRQEDLVIRLPKDKFPQNIDPQEGQRLQMEGKKGQVIEVVVTQVGDQNVTLDANHPLAGQNLNFELELVAIKP